jgi:adenylate cyclase
MTEQRRLAAILVADVVGYSKLMGSDEAGTLAQLEALGAEISSPRSPSTLDGCSSPWVTAS